MSNLKTYPAVTDASFLFGHMPEMQKDIHKLRRNQPLTDKDLSELERMLQEAAGEASQHVATAREQGLAVFVRTLVGLERDAAKQAFSDFLEGRTLTANQIEFMNLVIDYLTEHGAMEPDRLYESSFTDLNPLGVEGLFKPAEVTELFALIKRISTLAA